MMENVQRKQVQESKWLHCGALPSERSKVRSEDCRRWYPQFRVKRRILPKPQSDLAQQVIKDPTTLIS
jgi:hypothetical protein